MNKKTLKIISVILLLIAIITFVIWKIVTYEEKSFKKFDFNKEHIVYNTTEYNYLDTIIHAGLQCLEIDKAIVIIKPLINERELPIPDEYDVEAYIVGGNGLQYIIYIDKMTRGNSINVLSHELIHLKQYHNNELILKSDSIIWKGELINLDSYSYEERPWEKEAFHKQHSLKNYMIDILY